MALTRDQQDLLEQIAFLDLPDNEKLNATLLIKRLNEQRRQNAGERKADNIRMVQAFRVKTVDQRAAVDVEAAARKVALDKVIADLDAILVELALP